jgi:saccharopine dehydrogenase (NAD+, L-lysine-forming)
MLKIGLIREGKIPPDSRVPLAPQQCLQAEAQFPVKIQVQPSPNRCFSDDEFRQAGARVKDAMEECDILMGVKEVPISQLIPNKTYLFFSHTIKEQAYNRDLLRVILEKNIHLIDYEVLTDEEGRRVIAFGFFAGMVGAHNGILAYGNRTALLICAP